LKIAKSTNIDYSLRDIEKEGIPFDSEGARNGFIVDFFAKIYKKPPCDINRREGLIEEFLGPEILANKIVLDCKLTDLERDSLEVPLSLLELDCAMENANFRSAPGLDGLSMEFIRKFWKFLRGPLFKYANCCFEKGLLTFVPLVSD
jgi:hypothetical protein